MLLSKHKQNKKETVYEMSQFFRGRVKKSQKEEITFVYQSTNKITYLVEKL